MGFEPVAQRVVDACFPTRLAVFDGIHRVGIQADVDVFLRVSQRWPTAFGLEHFARGSAAQQLREHFAGRACLVKPLSPGFR